MLHFVPRPADQVRFPRLSDFQVQRSREGTVELGRESPAEHHTQIAAFRPVRLSAHLARNKLKELGPRKRIGNRNSDIVGFGFANHPDRLLNLVPAFARVSKLEEEAAADTQSS